MSRPRTEQEFSCCVQDRRSVPIWPHPALAFLALWRFNGKLPRDEPNLNPRPCTGASSISGFSLWVSDARSSWPPSTRSPGPSPWSAERMCKRFRGWPPPRRHPQDHRSDRPAVGMPLPLQSRQESPLAPPRVQRIGTKHHTSPSGKTYPPDGPHLATRGGPGAKLGRQSRRVGHSQTFVPIER